MPSPKPFAEQPPLMVPNPQETAGPDDDLIARLAYQRYEERGRQDGHDLEDWLEAEHELGLRRNSNPEASD